MIPVVIVSLAAFIVYVVVVIRTTSRRLDHDLPLLTAEGRECVRRGFHQWLSEPGSARDHCACGAAQVRRWTT